MKKTLTIIISLVLIIALSACSISTTRPSDSTGKQTTKTGKTEKTEKEKVTFKEQTVVDNDECTIKITGLDPDDKWGFAVKLYLENKSEDKTYMFSIDETSVNGIQLSVYFAVDVAAGKKTNKDYNISNTLLNEIGVTDYTDIELSFRAYDNNDWFADSVAETTTRIFPYGEDKAKAYVREPQSSDIVLVDNEHATAIVVGYDPDSTWGYTVNLFLVNKTDKKLTFSMDEVSVNGFMADPYYAMSVGAGKSAFGSVIWSESSFKDNDIENVEEIEFMLRVYDYDSWGTDRFADEAITLNP